MHLTISHAKLCRGVPKFERAGRVSRARVLIYGFSAMAVIYFGIQMSIRDSVEAEAAGNAHVSTRVQHACREERPRCDRSRPRYRRKSQKDSREPARNLSRPVTRPVEHEHAEKNKRGRERKARAKRRGRSSHE